MLNRAWQVLLNAHLIAHSFLSAFDASLAQERRRPRDYSPDHQELLRAMLVFASAGLDSMMKKAVEDALPSVIRRDTEAREQLRDFVERQLGRNEQPNYPMMASLFAAESPIDEMIALLVRHLTDNSLQSVDELLRVASYFAIERSAIIRNLDDLRGVFHARNQIVHEMDIDSSRPPNAARAQDEPVNLRPRDRDDMVAAANQILEVADAFLAAVDAKLTDI